MSTKVLDQTTWEESFFFCEYAKRNFELSSYNKGLIESSFQHVISTANFVFEERVPIGVAAFLLSEAINACDNIENKFEPVFKFPHLEDYIIYLAMLLPMKDLMFLSNKYCVNAAYLIFPYDMNSIISRIKNGDGIPQDFKFLPVERKCLINYVKNNDYVFFGVKVDLTVDEMIRLIKEQATLFKSRNDYENSERQAILKSKHNKSQYLGKYRGTENNDFYKATGIYLYDLYIKNHFDREEALGQHRSLDPNMKCDPNLQNKTKKDCPCDNWGKCRNNLMKYFEEAFAKVQTAVTGDDWIDHAKKVADTHDTVRYHENHLNYSDFNFFNINKKVLEKDFSYYTFFLDPGVAPAKPDTQNFALNE